MVHYLLCIKEIYSDYFVRFLEDKTKKDPLLFLNCTKSSRFSAVKSLIRKSSDFVCCSSLKTLPLYFGCTMFETNP